MYRILILVFTVFICTPPGYGQATAIPEGKADPDIHVDIYDPEKACNGTTLLPDHHDRNRPRVIEVNMKGDVIWQYVLPGDLKRYTNPGFDAELLPNGNILILLPRKGLYEVNRSGNVVWSHLDRKMTHDADRLPNGNTIYVFGGKDKMSDAQVKEVNSRGKVVWSWYARDCFSSSPYKEIYDDGWTHTNAVTRLKNGNTLISPRNFNFLVEVDRAGKVVKTIGKDYLHGQHDPEVISNGNILVANHDRPQEILEIDAGTGEIIWRYAVRGRENCPLRDADRLPNGNTLITGASAIIEVTHEKEIVWKLVLKNVVFSRPIDRAALGFYKAQRIPLP